MDSYFAFEKRGNLIYFCVEFRTHLPHVSGLRVPLAFSWKSGEHKGERRGGEEDEEGEVEDLQVVQSLLSFALSPGRDRLRGCDRCLDSQTSERRRHFMIS